MSEHLKAAREYLELPINPTVPSLTTFRAGVRHILAHLEAQQPLMEERVREIVREEIAAAAEREQADKADVEVAHEQLRQEGKSQSLLDRAVAEVEGMVAERDILHRKLEIAKEGLDAIRHGAFSPWKRAYEALDAIAKVDALATCDHDFVRTAGDWTGFRPVCSKCGMLAHQPQPATGSAPLG